MVANPLYGPHPQDDVAQLRALRLMPRGKWRGPGCGDQCVRVFAEIMGGGGREVIEAHDGAAHEAYVRAEYDALRSVVRTGPLVLSVPSRRVWIDGSEIHMGGRNWRLLALLAESPGRVFTYGKIADRLYGPGTLPYLGRSTLGNGGLSLRRQFGSAAWLIVTRPGFGLMLRDEPPTGEARP